MSDQPPGSRMRLSAWRLTVAVACFVAAGLILANCLDQSGSSNTARWTADQARALMLFLFGPAIGFLLGLGIGIFLHRPIAGGLMGLLVPVLIDVGIYGYLSR